MCNLTNVSVFLSMLCRLCVFFSSPDQVNFLVRSSTWHEFDFVFFLFFKPRNKQHNYSVLINRQLFFAVSRHSTSVDISDFLPSFLLLFLSLYKSLLLTSAVAENVCRGSFSNSRGRFRGKVRVRGCGYTAGARLISFRILTTGSQQHVCLTKEILSKDAFLPIFSFTNWEILQISFDLIRVG